jgi:hypothetical protein
MELRWRRELAAVSSEESVDNDDPAPARPDKQINAFGWVHPAGGACAIAIVGTATRGALFVLRASGGRFSSGSAPSICGRAAIRHETELG